MTTKSKRSEPQHLTDDELVAEIGRLATQRNQVTAELITHIAEMDARKLYREHAFSSMFAYVTTKLGMSEGTADKQINVGRAARRFPLMFEMFEMLEAGETHLSGLLLVTPHLTDDNHQELLTAIRHKSKRQAEQLIAEWFPKPPVPESIRKLPGPKPENRRDEPERDRAPPTSKAPALLPATAPGPLALPPQAAKPPCRKPDKMVPLAAASFKIQFTADQELVDRIERTKALLGPNLPRGELHELFSMALGCLVEKLEKKKFAKTSRPRRVTEVTEVAASCVSPGNSRHIPNEVKRQVAARDQQRCTFVDKDGNRCDERWGLKFHHAGTSFANGGAATVENITLHCRAHNQLVAEREFGSVYMQQRVRAAVKNRGSKKRVAERSAEP